LESTTAPPRAVLPSHPNLSSLDFEVGPRISALREVVDVLNATGAGANAAVDAMRRAAMTSFMVIFSKE
jgi:hypothetical protein